MPLGLAIIIIIATILALIAAHEAGHAIIARCCGVRISHIIVGVGRPLLQWKHPNRPTWTLALWPLGGSVELCNTRIRTVAPKEYSYCFDMKPVWMRIMILLAGAGANLSIAWIALVFYFLLGYLQHSPIIQSITTPSIAATAHIQTGDIIVSFADKPVASWQAVSMQLIMHLGDKHVPIGIQHHEGSQDRTYLDLSSIAKTKGSLLNKLGLQPNFSEQHPQVVAGLPWLEAVQQASNTLGTLLYMYCIILKQLLVGNISFFYLLGPIGFFFTMMNSIMQGVAIYLYGIANLSIAMALTNLLPIPGLDGGLIIYTLIEKARAKPMSIALERLLYRLAMTVLCVLFAQLFANDLQRYF
jgi:regulator of sigma E protease